MAVAAYDSDLTVANGGTVAVGNTATDSPGLWREADDATWDDQGVPGDETNFYINLANCISAQATKTGQGTIFYDNTSGGTVAVDTNGAVLIWCFWASPASLSVYASGGLKIITGNNLGEGTGEAFYAWDCSGSDFEPNPLGGWYCYALDPAIGSPDDTVGTPGAAPYDSWGMAVNCTAQARGYPFAVNAIRVGRCTLEVTLGDATAYGTFVGIQTFDTSTNIRYGLFQNINGAYRWQGLMSLGVTATAVDFRDSNRNISVANTPNVTSTFNKIEIHHASSNVEWTSINISSPGIYDTVAATASPGSFEMVANATVVKNTCVFTDLTTFIYQSNATLTSCTHRRCGIITQAGATMTDGVIDASAETHAILATNPSAISGYNFVSSGSGHGVRCDTIGTFNWTGNFDTGYTGTRGSNLISSTGSADAMFYNNSGGLITLNVAGGGQSPSVRNGAGATTQVNATVNVTFDKMRDNSEVWVFEQGTYTQISGGHVEDATTGTTDDRSFTWSYTAGAFVDYKIHCHADGDETFKVIEVYNYEVPTTDTTLDIQQQKNLNMEYIA